MKKTTFLLAFLISAIFAKGQFNQVPHGNGSQETYELGINGTTIGFHLRMSFADTAAANAYMAGALKGQAGLIIRCVDDEWMRSNDLQKWNKVNGISSAITSISQGYGIVATPNPIISTGTIKADTFNMSTHWYVDSSFDRRKDITGFYSEQSPYLFSGNITEQSNSVANHWWDDGGATSNGDTLFTFGGWYTPGGSEVWLNDSVYYTTHINTGTPSTFTLSPTRLPFKGDAFITFKSKGFQYIIGASNANPSLQQTVWRTNSMISPLTVMTSDAGWGARFGAGGCSDDNGNLYVLGGQRPDSNTIASNYNDIWKSSDFGATWTRVANDVNIGGVYFLGQEIHKVTQYFNGRIYILGGNLYFAPPYGVFSNKVYSASIEDLTKWREEQSIPANPVSYGSSGVWDGKIFVQGGFSLEEGNTRAIYYLDKSGVWHNYPYVYTDNNSSNLIEPTHATNLTVYRDALVRVLGNNSNSCYVLSRSAYSPLTNFRDSITATTGIITNVIAETIKKGAGTDLVIYNQISSPQTADFMINGKGIIGVSSNTDNGNRLQVDGDANIAGKIGIGINAPGVKLDVVDGSGAAQARIRFNNTYFYDMTVDGSNLLTILPNTNNNSRWWYNIRQIDVGTAPVNIFAAGSGYPGIGYNLLAGNFANTYTVRNGGDPQYLIEMGRGDAIRFNTSPSASAGATPSFTEVLTLLLNGNVGIGQSTPTEKLQVENGNIYLSGTSNKMIDFYSASGWHYKHRIVNDDFFLTDAGSTDFISLYYNGGGTGKYTSLGNGVLNVFNGGNVGLGTASIAASAKMEIQSTAQGFLPPRMTTTQKNAISSPAEGLVIYDSTLHKLCVYTGGAWETITSL